MRPSNFIFSLLLLAALPAFAQSSSDSLTFQGRVVNSQGIPLKDAVIEGILTDIGLRTGIDGNFDLTLPASGDTMTISKEGLGSFKFTVDYSYKGVIVLGENGGAWMSYGEYLKQMAGTSQTYFDAGMKFFKGEADGTPDYKKAFACFWRAANMEHEASKYYLGKMFDEGLGITQNSPNAAYWYLQAKKTADAHLRLGTMLAEGIGVQQDYQAAAQHFFSATELGDNGEAKKNLDELIEKGLAKREDIVDNKVYEIVETNAQFPGGDNNCYKWLAQHIRYPSIALEQGIMGRVIVQFVVDRDGTITDAIALKSPDPSLSKEAVRLVGLMPRWKPATQGGKTVRSRFRLPIMFNIK